MPGLRSASWLVPAVLLTAPGCDSLWGRFSAPAAALCTREMQGCLNGSLPCPSGPGDPRAEALRLCTVRQTVDAFDSALYPNIDILFMIDNSPSMLPKQKTLADSFPRFMRKIESLQANYHLGVITSDTGILSAPGMGGVMGVCATVSGDDGVLQATSCLNRSMLSAESQAVCQQVCSNSNFVPQDGKRYISRINRKSNVPEDLQVDLETGRVYDLGPERAFKCMALVGEAGCGVESQLEATRRALDGHRIENDGFLRPDSLLALILLTDEDDCSVRASQRQVNTANTTDCNSPDYDAPASCYNLDYRCIGSSWTCNEPMNTIGRKTGCRERPASYLEPVDTYVNFFKSLRPRGSLFISGIWSPSLADGGKLVVQNSGGVMMSSMLATASGPDASCVADNDPRFTGGAQLRLSHLATSFPGSIEVSLCNKSGYPAALESLASAVATRTVRCLTAPPRLVDGKADCTVGYVAPAEPAAPPSQLLPQCSARCCGAWAAADIPRATHPLIEQACQGEVSEPCYCAVSSQLPFICSGSAIAGLWRSASTPVPADKSVAFQCNTIKAAEQ